MVIISKVLCLREREGEERRACARRMRVQTLFSVQEKTQVEADITLFNSLNLFKVREGSMGTRTAISFRKIYI